jgi:hypothetical protein
MEQIIGKDGKVIQQSRNLRGIRSYVGKNLIKHILISKQADGEGYLRIRFDDGASFSTTFCNYKVLCYTLRNWRNLYGAELFIGGDTPSDVRSVGKIDYHNGYLCLQGTW